MTHGPVNRQLLGLMGPMVFGLFSVLAFNLVDTYFVSLLGTQPLAAISLTFPVVMAVGSVAMGVGAGMTSVLARSIGQGDKRDGVRLTTHGIVLAGGMAAMVSALGWATIDPLFRLLGADDLLLPQVRDYMEVWYLGAAVLVIPMVGMAAIRATGDTRTPAVVMTVSAALNAVLDPILIFGWGPIPALGLRGAAIATLLGRALTLLFALWVLVMRERLVQLSPPYRHGWLTSWRRILRIGGPATLTNLAQPLTMGLVTHIAASLGPSAVAALGAGGRVENVAIIPLIAISAGLSPFVGQNHGAGIHRRVQEAVRVSLGASTVLGFLTCCTLALQATSIADVFSDDPSVTEPLASYLTIVPIGHLLLGTLFVASATLNAMGRPMPATLLTLLRAPVLVGICASLGAQFGGLDGLFEGIALAMSISGIVAVGFLWPLWGPSTDTPDGRADNSATLSPRD